MGEEALGLGADGLFPRRERRSRVRIWHWRIPGGCFGLQGHGQNMRGLAGRWGLLIRAFCIMDGWAPVSYTHLRAHETVLDLVCRLLLEKKRKNKNKKINI